MEYIFNEKGEVLLEKRGRLILSETEKYPGCYGYADGAWYAINQNGYFATIRQSTVPKILKITLLLIS